MNWIALTLIVTVAIFALGALIDRAWQRRRKASLPWISDEELRRTCPPTMNPDAWMSSRRSLARLLQLDAERLSPDMRLDILSKHFRLFGVSNIDLDDTFATEFADVPSARMASLATVGDIMLLVIERNKVNPPPP